jgi:hypothetical protein
MLIIYWYQVRNESEIVFINSDTDVCVDKFWDISHLQKQLGEQCPQLQIRGCNDLREIDTVLDVPFRLFFWPSWARGGFRNFLEGALLKLGINSAEVTPSNSTLVNFSDTHLVSQLLETVRSTRRSRRMLQIHGFGHSRHYC